jgi:hypothetical protein
LQLIVKNSRSTTVGCREPDLQAIAHDAFEAHSSVFYWITDDQKMDGITTCGICSNDMPWYLREMQPFDPLNIARLSGSKKRVATLSIDRNLAPANEFHYYEKYMQSCGIYDVLDFLFWDGPRAIAGLGVIKPRTIRRSRPRQFGSRVPSSHCWNQSFRATQKLSDNVYGGACGKITI